MGMKPMRKVLLLRCSDAFLGAENVVLQLALNLQCCGYEPLVAVTQDDGQVTPELALRAEANGVKTKIFKAAGAFDFSVVRRIKSYIENESIDIIHTHGYRENIYALLSGYIKNTVATNHLWKRSTRKLKIYAFIDSIVMRLIPAVVAVSAPIRDEMLERGLSDKRLHIVSNGINVSTHAKCCTQEQVNRMFSVPEGATCFVMVSSLTLEKGHIYALEAIAALDNNLKNQVYLVVIGDGQEFENLQRVALTLGLEGNVYFAGRRNDVTDILPFMDVFLMPSLKEGLPMAMLEAMAAGLPVIASDVGDIPYVFSLSKEKFGFLLESKNVGQISDAIVAALKNRESLCAWGESAKKLVARSFSAEAMTAEYAEIYASLTSLD